MRLARSMSRAWLDLAPAEQQQDGSMALREVDPIARADVHTHLTHPTAHRPGVAEIAQAG
jgi:hypothetical protein